MIPEISVDFIITGFQISSDEITTLLGMNPTRTWRLGDFIERTKLRRKHNGWCFSVNNVISSYRFEDYVNPLLEILLPKAETIRYICNEYGLESEISFAAYVVDETPDIHFGQKTLSMFAELMTTLDIDIILISGD